MSAIGSGKSVLVTGAGSGIGQATAQVFSQNGYHVILLGRSLQKLSAVQSQLKGPSEAYSCDIGDLAQVKKTIGHLQQKNVRLYSVINNAGIFDRRNFAESSDELWRRHFETNLLGPARVARECLSILESPASIVNVSSTLGLRPVAKTAVYSAMKAGLVSMTKTLALEWAPNGIRVNAICPGLVETPIHGPLTDEARDGFHKSQPLGRMGTPQEIADAILFLATHAWMTGSILSVDGGISL